MILPRELAAAVAQADADRDVHVMVLSGAGKAFCCGLRSGPLRRGQWPQSGRAGDALGSDARFPIHVAKHPGVYVSIPSNEASNL